MFELKTNRTNILDRIEYESKVENGLNIQKQRTMKLLRELIKEMQQLNRKSKYLKEHIQGKEKDIKYNTNQIIYKNNYLNERRMTYNTLKIKAKQYDSFLLSSETYRLLSFWITKDYTIKLELLYRGTRNNFSKIFLIKLLIKKNH